jgi:carbon monoxide dehydrogenase subunit G
MDLTHTFTVPLGVEETWGHFNDIASVAECFPGAQVTEFDGNSFSGSCKVKLGPIALVYNGSGSFVEKDEEAHRFVVDAKGKDKRGNGTAGAHVTLSMEETDGSTTVTVVTDLAITGKPAQFGRGVMQDVSDKLLGQFVACLEERFVAQPEPAAEEAATADARAGDDVQDGLSGATPGAASAGASRAGFTAGTPSASAPRPAGTRKAASSDDALDLGATVLPVLLKSYWKQAAGALLVLLVLRRLLSRSRS